MKIEFEDKDGVFEVPSVYHVCPRCEGKGVHTNPAIDGDGITERDAQELGPDFMEDYMNGVYDVRCSQCVGLRVIPVPSRIEMSPSQIARVDAYVKEEQDFADQCAAEKRYGG